jgi:hypothetical protein
MFPNKLIAITTAKEKGVPTTPDSLLLFTLTFDFLIDGKEHRLIVNAKRVIGSDPSDTAVEVYPPKNPRHGQPVKAYGQMN